jgi:prophage tail gpP-like protein
VSGRVEVRRGASVFRGWKSVTVDTGIEEAVSAASMVVAGVVGASDDMILDGEEIAILHDGEVVFTGYVDDVAPTENATGSSVALGARSKSCDAVDCSTPIGSWKSIKLGDLIAKWISPYNFGVNDEAGVLNTTIPRFRVQAGESIFDAIDRITREMRILITDDENGLLTFTRAGVRGVADDALVMGGNVLAMSGRQSGRERYSEIEVKGQTTTGELDFTTTGTFEDRRVTRYRKLVVVPEKGVSAGEAQWRAQWEALTRAGRSVQYTYTVRGWRQSTGALWRKNTDVFVTDPRRRFNATPMLITSLQYQLSDSGTTTAITVSPASAYTPEPVREPRSGAGGRTSGRWSKWDAGGRE